MKNEKAFTLIELLVVVLIIGILAAVALPQYKLAVAKSRFAAIRPLVATIVKAEESYYLAHGEYTSQINDLDIPPAKFTGHSNGILNEHFSINITQPRIDIRYCPNASNNSCTNLNAEYVYYIRLNNATGQATESCNGNTDFGRQICRSYGF